MTQGGESRAAEVEIEDGNDVASGRELSALVTNLPVVAVVRRLEPDEGTFLASTDINLVVAPGVDIARWNFGDLDLFSIDFDAFCDHLELGEIALFTDSFLRPGIERPSRVFA